MVIEGNLTFRRDIDHVLEPVVVPFLQNNADVTLYQQDNARPHSTYYNRLVWTKQCASVTLASILS